MHFKTATPNTDFHEICVHLDRGNNHTSGYRFLYMSLPSDLNLTITSLYSLYIVTKVNIP